VAPVTGGVPHTQQDGYVSVSRLGEGVLSPLPPVDRIVFVLEEVRRGGVSETVWHLVET
jgi:hypothetical protein